MHILLLLLFRLVPRVGDQERKIKYQRDKYKFKGYAVIEK